MQLKNYKNFMNYEIRESTLSNSIYIMCVVMFVYHCELFTFRINYVLLHNIIK